MGPQRQVQVCCGRCNTLPQTSRFKNNMNASLPVSGGRSRTALPKWTSGLRGAGSFWRLCGAPICRPCPAATGTRILWLVAPCDSKLCFPRPAPSPLARTSAGPLHKPGSSPISGAVTLLTSAPDILTHGVTPSRAQGIRTGTSLEAQHSARHTGTTPHTAAPGPEAELQNGPREATESVRTLGDRITAPSWRPVSEDRGCGGQASSGGPEKEEARGG